MKEKNPYCQCLYYSSNALARVLTKLGEEAFGKTGLSPSHAFLLMAAIRSPGIQPSELSDLLMLTPSTVTRLIEKLESKGLAERKVDGKMTMVYPTVAGRKMEKMLMDAWSGLYERYVDVLGEKAARILTEGVYDAAVRLETR